MSRGEAALKGVPGVGEASINLATGTATVSLSGQNMSQVQCTVVSNKMMMCASTAF